MLRFSLSAGLLAAVALAIAADPAPSAKLQFTAQSRKLQAARKPMRNPDGTVVEVTENVEMVFPTKREVDPRQAAVVICDMWDDHWCKSAAKRCDALARKAAPVVDSLRERGATIIHCPSDCMAYYADHPARKRAQAVKPTEPPKPKALPDPPLPIDDKDGGCDDDPPAKFSKAWTKEHAAIRIDPDKDYVTDSGKEVYSILAARGIKTVFVMGVHTNMCVLNRTFAIKQLRRWDVDCVLVRDLTDAMYDPRKSPFVGHDEGTRLVVAYIERNWCPSVESKELMK